MKRRVIVWRITQDCNMRCRFCSYSHDVDRLRDSADDKEIQRLISILTEYRRVSGNKLLISWIGGEPFLWKNIIKYSKQLKDNEIEVSTTTNGLLLANNGLREDVCKCLSEIIFSIDGFAECDDDVRQFPGHFQAVSENIRAINSIKKASGSRIKLKVNTILMQRNIAEFEKFCEYLLTLGIEEVTFNRLGGNDRPEFYGANRLLPEQVIRFQKGFSDLKNKFEQKGLLIHGDNKYLDRFLSASKNEKNPLLECDPASWFWFINENGFISPCSYTSYEYKYSTKNILSAYDIDKVEGYFRNERAKNRSKWCDDCYCTQIYNKFQ